MDYKHRLIEKKILRVGEHFPVTVLVGARQVGKTTLLRHLLPNVAQVTFDPVIDINNARQDPELFLKNMNTPLLLDEIQYAPELLSVIKRWVDENKTPGQYWLTGSQNLSMLKNVAESLAGRAAVLSLYPMTLGELQNAPSTWIVDFLQNPQQFLQAPHETLQRLPSKSLFSVLWKGG